MSAKNQIYEVTMFNLMADLRWMDYCRDCELNDLPPQKRSNFNQFMLFEYKRGYVIDGNYPLYYRTRKQALKVLGLD